MYVLSIVQSDILSITLSMSGMLRESPGTVKSILPISGIPEEGNSVEVTPQGDFNEGGMFKQKYVAIKCSH